MDIDKPDTLSIANQPLDWGGTLYQSFTIGLGFDLATRALLHADKAWGTAMKSIAPGDCMDTGLPKKQPEWLLAGSAMSAGGAPVPGMLVDVSVGQSRRRLLIQGGQTQNGPATFTAMPLIWANTWGGPDSPENPLGCGIAPDRKTGTVKQPTITDAALPYGAAACCGPLGAWPCRMKNMGTYDAEWLKKRWPGVPDDFDWAFFNLAQPPQRLHSPLLVDETFVLRGLHPDYAELVSRLPGKNVLASVKTKAAPEDWKALKIIPDTLWLFPNHLTGIVLWHGLLPCADEAGSDILAVRLRLEPPEDADAVSPVAVDAGKLPGAEAIPQNGAAMGAQVPEAAGAPEEAAGAVLAGAGLAAGGVAAASVPRKSATPQDAPKTPAPPAAEAQPKISEEQAAIAQLQSDALADMDDTVNEINSVLAESGLPPMTEEQIAEAKERVINTTNAMQNSLAEADSQSDDPSELLKKAGVPQDHIDAFNLAIELPPPNPDEFTDPRAWQAAVDAFILQFETLLSPAKGVSDMLRTGLEVMGPGGDKKIDEMAGPELGIEEMLVKSGMSAEDAVKFSQWAEADEEASFPGIDDMQGLSAYASELETKLGFPAGSVSSRIDSVREAMEEAGLIEPPSGGAPLPGVEKNAINDAGTDDEKKDAPQAPAAAQNVEGPSVKDASPASAAGVNASAAPASAHASRNAPLDRAAALSLMLAGTCLAGANLEGADLSGLNMAGQHLEGASLLRCNLENANLSGAHLESADLSGVNAKNAQFVGACLTDAKLYNFAAPEADFTGADLSDAVLAKANLQSATLHKITGTGLNAENACLAKAKIRFCSLDRANFTGADLAEADFHQAMLENANFTGANLTKTTFCHGTSVSGAFFTSAGLAGGAWKEVAGKKCVFTGAQAPGAGFNDCDFTASSWRGANAPNADFSRCLMRDADLRGANFFKASLRETNLEDADLGGANLYGSDLYRLHMNGATRTEGTNFTSTIIAARKEVR